VEVKDGFIGKGFEPVEFYFFDFHWIIEIPSDSIPRRGKKYQ
jgi:hypothetical protein